MADEHNASEVAGPDPDPTAVEPAPEPASESASEPASESTELVRIVAEQPRVPKPDVKNSVVLATAACLLAFTGVCGVAIWTASRFDGGVPGITSPANGHREAPIIPVSERTGHPAEPGTQPPGGPAEPAPGPRATTPQTGRGSDRPPAAPDWGALQYPIDCGGGPVEVVKALPVPPEAGGRYVVQVHCVAGSGTAPDALYGYTLGADGTPTPTRTLLDTTADRVVRSLTATADGKITAELLGWSSDLVPRSSPDVTETRVLTP
ncbi:hypothetical protein [Yinghuangia seranimata]|uniref:hypothetical protein n=1 Tax=Yinghuangia seranimata TaxID=408067 RepID=UPI00248BF64E|nr:hypothetical protein [Yinghuangia seranimata]MDI2126640.1 hypothetical protein [Yinghuangia seranimata]